MSAIEEQMATKDNPIGLIVGTSVTLLGLIVGGVAYVIKEDASLQQQVKTQEYRLADLYVAVKGTPPNFGDSHSAPMQTVEFDSSLIDRVEALERSRSALQSLDPRLKQLRAQVEQNQQALADLRKVVEDSSSPGADPTTKIRIDSLERNMRELELLVKDPNGKIPIKEASSKAVERNGFRFEVVACRLSGSRLTAEVNVTNLNQRDIQLSIGQKGDQGTRAYDSKNTPYELDSLTFSGVDEPMHYSDSRVTLRMISGVAAPLKMFFGNANDATSPLAKLVLMCNCNDREIGEESWPVEFGLVPFEKL